MSHIFSPPAWKQRNSRAERTRQLWDKPICRLFPPFSTVSQSFRNGKYVKIYFGNLHNATCARHRRCQPGFTFGRLSMQKRLPATQQTAAGCVEGLVSRLGCCSGCMDGHGDLPTNCSWRRRVEAAGIRSKSWTGQQRRTPLLEVDTIFPSSSSNQPDCDGKPHQAAAISRWRP
jgi:hypothetical protein